MSPITWCTLSIIAFGWGFLIVVGLSFTPNSLSNGMKSFLNSKPLSKCTYLGFRYINQIWSNSLEIQAEVSSTLCTSTIVNQPLLWSINNMTVKVKIIGIPLASSSYIFIVYKPMRSACTSTNGVTSATFTGNLPYLGFPPLNFYKSHTYLQVKHNPLPNPSKHTITVCFLQDMWYPDSLGNGDIN